MTLGDAARDPCAPSGCSGRPQREDKPSNATNWEDRCGFPGMDARFSELPWQNRAPLSNPREYSSPASTGESVSLCSLPQGRPQQTASSRRQSRAIRWDPNWQHHWPRWAGGEEEPANKGPRCTEASFQGEKTHPKSDFNRLTMQMYSGPAGHFWL